MSIRKSEAPARRRRRSPEDAREEILASARSLLLSQGPEAVTLKAVAGELGMSHANLLHHFGSAAGLQSELARFMADRVNAKIAAAVEKARAGEADARDIADMTFDAFGKGGAGALAAWMILSGNRDALAGILGSIRNLVAQLSVGHEDRHVPDTTLWLVLLALGDALLGEPIADALELPHDTAREIAAKRLRAQIERSIHDQP